MSPSLDNTQDNQLADQALKIFGDVWTLLIIHALSGATRRFNDLQRALAISPTTLTSRLKKLESYGLIMQEKQTVDQLSVIYKLTDKGKNMLPVLNAIDSFAKKYL
jgi:DNA-binding HxlR family transcriptional regulator